MQVRGEGAPGAAGDPPPHTPLVRSGSSFKERAQFLLKKMQLPHLKDLILFSLLTTQIGEESVANFADTAHTLILLLLLRRS